MLYYATNQLAGIMRASMSETVLHDMQQEVQSNKQIKLKQKDNTIGF